MFVFSDNSTGYQVCLYNCSKKYLPNDFPKKDKKLILIKYIKFSSLWRKGENYTARRVRC